MWLEKHGDGVSFDALPNHATKRIISAFIGGVAFDAVPNLVTKHIISVLIQELYPFRGIAHSCQVSHHQHRSDGGCMRTFNRAFHHSCGVGRFPRHSKPIRVLLCIVILDVMDSFFHLIWLMPMLSHESCWCDSQFGHEAQHL